HVIEFANGMLETAKKPLPRPPKPAAGEPAGAPVTGEVTGEATLAPTEVAATGEDATATPEPVAGVGSAPLDAPAMDPVTPDPGSAAPEEKPELPNAPVG